VSLAGLIFVMVAGTAGYVGFGFGFIDAIFQTITTVTTVGFGELHPFSQPEEIFTIFLIFVGVGTAAYTLGVLIETLVEGQIGDLVGRRRMEQRIKSMSGHVVLCGWGRVGSSIARFVTGAGQDMVVVEKSTERLAAVTIPYVEGDATDDSVLREAGIERARVLVTALSDDADNLYVTLTARSLRPDLLIVARAVSDTADAKLRQAGADRVVNPQSIGGQRMAAFAMQPHVAEFVDVVMHDGSLEFRLEQVVVAEGSPLSGQTLRGARLHERTGALVLAMRDSSGSFRTNPESEALIRSGDVLIIIGTESQVEALCREAQPGGANIRTVAGSRRGDGPAGP
jgi:voltage-gated potassium channel